MKSKALKIASVTLVVLLLLVVAGHLGDVLAQTATTSASPSATPTATPDTLPEAGISTPTVFGMAIGAIAIFLSLALAL